MAESSLPGGATLLASYADPDWKSDKINRLGQAVAGAFSSYQARKEQERQREMEEIQNFLSLAQQYPELATSQGGEFKAKYGERYPLVGGMVDVLGNKASEAAAVRAAGEKWLATQQQMESGYAQRQQAVAALPDQVPAPGFEWLPPEVTSQVPVPMVPNPAKQQAAAAVAGINPAMAPLLAAQQLTPQERARARLWAQANKIPMPTEFDAFDDLSPEGRAVLAQQMGLLTGVAGDWALAQGEMTVSPADLAAREHSTGERVARQEYGTSERLAEQEFRQQTRTEDVDQSAVEHARRLEIERIRDQRSGRRASGDGKGVQLWERALDESEALVGGWAAGLTAAKETAADKPKAAQSYMTTRGRRPAELTPAQARTIQRELAERVGDGVIDAAEADTLMAEMVAEYTTWTGKGKPASEALNMALSLGVEDETPERAISALPLPEGISAEQEQIIRSQAMADYQRLRAAGKSHREAMKTILED